MRRLGVCLLLSWLCAAPVFAAILQLQVQDINWLGSEGVGYSPFSDANNLDKVYFDIQPENSFSGAYFVTFSKGQNSSDYNRRAVNGQDAISYQIYGEQDRQFPLKAIPDLVRSRDVIVGDVTQPGQTQRQVFYVSVPPHQYVKPGTYTDVIDLKIYSGSQDNDVSRVEIDSARIQVRIKVVDVMQIAVGNDAFGSTGSTLRIALERIEPGRVEECAIRVRSNRDFNLLIGSQNGGMFHHENSRVKVGIPYTFMLDNQRLDLSQPLPARVLRPNVPGDVMEFSFLAKIKVGPTKKAFRGRYSDQFSLELVPVD